MGHDDSHNLDDENALAGSDTDAGGREGGGPGEGGSGGSGDGGATGTPSSDPQVEEPPSGPQERNEAVSGGGMANTGDDDEPGPALEDADS